VHLKMILVAGPTQNEEIMWMSSTGSVWKPEMRDGSHKLTILLGLGKVGDNVNIMTSVLDGGKEPLFSPNLKVIWRDKLNAH